jgi:CBS domain-containing protein
MERKGVQHLAVTDDVGQVVGVIRNQELLQFRSYGPIVFTREVQQSRTPDDVAKCCRRVPALVKALLDSGAHPHHVTKLITSVCDAATTRLIELSEAELGPPPAKFAFFALGSHGRHEMTLASDQDNALVFESPDDPSELPAVESYFGKLGEFVCLWLERAGYPACPGKVMARNPRWCKPIGVWKRYFSEWIVLPEPQQLLEFTIFFDFRSVHGSAELAEELRSHIYKELRAVPSFFPHFAQDALAFKPPTRLFGRIMGGEHPGDLDLKDVLIPIVSFARLFSLQRGLDDTHTTDRLNALLKLQVIHESSCQEMTFAYEFLMRLRLRHQAASLVSGQTPDNSLNVRELGQMEQTLLHQSFAQITVVQKRISIEFLAGTV